MYSAYTPTHPESGDTQLGHTNTQTHMCPIPSHADLHPLLHKCLQLINTQTHVHTQEILYTQNSEYIHMLTVVLHTQVQVHEQTCTWSCGCVNIHAHISPLGTQIPGDTLILTKVCDCTLECSVGEQTQGSRSEHKPDGRTIPQSGP